MKMGLLLTTVLTSALISGCASRYALLENPETKQKVYCANEGWGWLGAPIAISNFNSCVKRLEKQGYQKITDQRAD